MDEPIDWSSLPRPKFGHDVWFSLMLPDEVAKLNRLLSAINKWRSIEVSEFDEFKVKVESNPNPAWEDHGYDPLADEAFMMLETERVMFANLGVTIASAAENFLIGICKMRQVDCVNDRGETDFGIACQSLGKSLNVVISDLPGYQGNQRARMLGNCFKHSEGKTNERFVRKYGGNLGESIEYESESWEEMIAETETFLSEVIGLLKTDPHSS